jgi:hypothetical protein
MNDLAEQEMAVEKLRVRSDKSIFVSVSSFRDRLCAGTVENVFRYAKHPERIFVGLVDQRCSRKSLLAGKCFSGYSEAENKGYFDSFKMLDHEPDCVREVCRSNVTKQYCDSGQVRIVLHLCATAVKC